MNKKLNTILLSIFWIFIFITHGYIFLFSSQTGIFTSEIETEVISNIYEENGYKNIGNYICDDIDVRWSVDCIDWNLKVKIQQWIILLSTTFNLFFGWEFGIYIYILGLSLFWCIIIMLFISRLAWSKVIWIATATLFTFWFPIIYWNNFLFWNFSWLIFFIYSLCLYIQFRSTRKYVYLFLTFFFFWFWFLMRVENIIWFVIFLSTIALFEFDQWFDKKRIFKYILAWIFFLMPTWVVLYMNYQLNDNIFILWYTDKLDTNITNTKDTELLENEPKIIWSVLNNLKKFPLIKHPVKKMNASEAFSWISSRLSIELDRFFPFSPVFLIFFLSFVYRIIKNKSIDKIWLLTFFWFTLLWSISELTWYHLWWNNTNPYHISYYSRYRWSIYLIFIFVIVFWLLKTLKKNAIIPFMLLLLLTLNVTFTHFNKSLVGKKNQKIAMVRIQNTVKDNFKKWDIIVSEYYFSRIKNYPTISPYKNVWWRYLAMFQSVTIDKELAKISIENLFEDYNRLHLIEREDHKSTYLNLSDYYSKKTKYSIDEKMVSPWITYTILSLKNKKYE